MKNQRTRTTPKTYFSQPNSRGAEWNKIYIAEVKSAADVSRMGRLWVWIPELCVDLETGPDGSDPRTWISVSYATPFGGSTSVRKNTNQNNYSGTQKSYGFVGVPPDEGNQVAVFFANGDPARGYWFSCIFSEGTAESLPAYGSRDDKTVVGNTNKRTEVNTSSSTKPVVEPLQQGLQTQGLVDDQVRGISYSGMYRTGDYGTDKDERNVEEHLYKPAKVYGMLTPGGHHFVMDDGYQNSNGATENSIIRLRTKSGSQVLIDDTTGFVYFITKDGKTWIEITDQYGGQVDVYSTNSISLHAENGDVNIKAGNDIILEAGKSFYLTTGDDILMKAADTVQTKSGARTTFESGSDMNLKSGSTMRQTSGADFNVLSAGNYKETAPRIDMNGPTASAAFSAVEPLLPRRTPEHEPWAPHTFKKGSAGAPPVDSGPGRATYEQTTPGQVEEYDVEVIPFSGNLPGTVCGMSEDETRAWLGTLGRRESSDSYTIRNTIGYSGKYQFGEIALESVGFLKKGAAKSGGDAYQRELDNPNNWTGLEVNGQKINSIQDYLASADAQELAMIRLANQNCADLQRRGIDMANLPVSDRAGLLTAAHLGGASGAAKFWNGGGVRRDRYGTSTGDYFNLGKNALKGFDI